MPGFTIRRALYAIVRGTYQVLVCLPPVILSGCGTTQTKDEVVVVEVMSTEPIQDRPGHRPAHVVAPLPVLPPLAPPEVLAEKLEPVRGGEQALPPFRGPEPCKMALTGRSPVARACSEGGTKKALELMQRFVRRAKGQGMVFQCADCHPDDEDYSKLAPGADDEFRKLLFLSRPAD